MTHAVGADQIAKKIVEHSGQEGTGTAKPQEASMDDQNRLQEALRQHQTNAEQSSQVQQQTNTVPVQQQDHVTSPKTMGDSILKGMDGLRDGVKNVGEKAQSIATQGGVSPQEMMKIQMQASQMMVDTQLAGQVPGKLEQDMDTLLKSS
ncbi:MAG: hypothetical protein V2J55_08360 [Candidatus Competibacteraceae bacterium]|jgi:hypothetical protein|nr:hypothetical protein [Candidatus Competibacteraceae bacterium]